MLEGDSTEVQSEAVAYPGEETPLIGYPAIIIRGDSIMFVGD